MDYCYACRRTLNGALVCPGCGAYAPDIAPPASAYQGDSTTTAAWESYGLAPSGHPGSAGPFPDVHVPGHAAPHGGFTAPDEHAYAPHPGYPGGSPALTNGHGHAGRAESARPRLAALIDAETDSRDDGEQPESGGTPSVLGPASLAPTLHRGRAARRRQMARWKKNRRRAGVATAVALFGGGVTVASMQNHSGRSGATTASAADPQAPSALQTDNTSVSVPTDRSAPDAAPAHVAPQHDAAARPAPRTTHAGPDSITSIPTTVIPSGQPVSYSSATKQLPSTSTTTAPVAPTDNGSGSTTAGNGSGSGSGSGSGTTTTTPPATPPSSAPPATTSPSTPPPQQLCLLIICLG